MIELIILSICTFLMLSYIYNNQITENFDNVYLKTCPLDYKSRVTSNGDILCYDKSQELIGNQISGDKKCILNGNGSDSCIEYLSKYYSNNNKKCPKSMPTFFMVNGVQKCTSGKLNSVVNGPLDTSKSICTIYNSTKDKTSSDSCYVQKKLAESRCPAGTRCTKSIASFYGSMYIKKQWMDTNKMPKTKYEIVS